MESLGTKGRQTYMGRNYLRNGEANLSNTLHGGLLVLEHGDHVILRPHPEILSSGDLLGGVHTGVPQRWPSHPAMGTETCDFTGFFCVDRGRNQRFFFGSGGGGSGPIQPNTLWGGGARGDPLLGGQFWIQILFGWFAMKMEENPLPICPGNSGPVLAELSSQDPSPASVLTDMSLWRPFTRDRTIFPGGRSVPFSREPDNHHH